MATKREHLQANERLWLSAFGYGVLLVIGVGLLLILAQTAGLRARVPAHEPMQTGAVDRASSAEAAIYVPLTERYEAQETVLYLPVMASQYPPPPTVFGAQITSGRAHRTAPLASAAGLTWIRYGEIEWGQVEPVPGQRQWGALASFERELRALNRIGLTPAVVIFGTPDWAQKRAGYFCGPIREEALDDYARFVADLVKRYSVPPFNIKHWELGNEPDIDPALVGPDSRFGCWGDSADPYYGGGYYAEMLKRVYPAVKEADPAAQVLIGGLLLDCDPTNPLLGGGQQNSCHAGNFLEGILANGGAAYFDILTYHAYTHWSVGVKDWDLNHLAWKSRGGALLGKAHFIQELLGRYQVQKPLLMNEGGLLCHPNNAICPDASFYDAQANYAVRLYARTWANGLLGSIWYTLNGPGWREGGLLDENQQPRPAYVALQFFAERVRHARYVRPLSHDLLEGYEFRRGRTRIQLYWTNSAATATLPIPVGTVEILDKLGQPVTAGGALLEVGFEPRYIIVQD